MAEPGDGGGLLVEERLGDEGVVGAAIQGHEEVLIVDGDVAAGLDEFAVELCGFHGLAALEALGQPAVASVGQNGQDDI